MTVTATVTVADDIVTLKLDDGAGTTLDLTLDEKATSALISDLWDRREEVHQYKRSPTV